jgi:hypothetical protein
MTFHDHLEPARATTLKSSFQMRTFELGRFPPSANRLIWPCRLAKFSIQSNSRGPSGVDARFYRRFYHMTPTDAQTEGVPAGRG